MTIQKKEHFKPLHIGIFTDDFYPNSGGIARSIELQVKSLIADGHQVTLFAPNVFFVPPVNSQYEALKFLRFPNTPSFLCSLRFGKRTVDYIVKKYKLDVVHSQNERGSMFLAARISRELGIPHIHTFHSNYAGIHEASPFFSAVNTLAYMQLAPFIMRRLRPDKKLSRVRIPRHLAAKEDSKLAIMDWRSLASLAQYTDSFTSPADFMINNINDSTEGRTTDGSFVIPNGVNPVFAKAQRIRAPDDIVRFFSCGRLDSEKRVDIIIRAYAQLNKADSELYILGSGSELSKLKRLADDVVKNGRVVFLGHYEDHERVANEFANADVFILSSYHFDAQGMVLGEAASAGAAIMYCDGRLKIGVSDQNSLLVSPGIESHHDGMLYLYKNPDKRKVMSVASKNLAGKLSPEKMEKSFIKAYRHTLKTH